MLSKEERLLYSLAGVNKVLDILDVEGIESRVKSEDGTTETVDCYKEIKRCVAECIKNTQPYKFEDLKVDMWVYDKEYDQCVRIFHIEKEDKIIIIDCDNFQQFEENRFFPVQMANMKGDWV